MRRRTLGFVLLAVAVPSVANAAPPLDAAPSAPPRPAEHNSLRGSLGLFHTALADVGDPFQLRFRAHLDGTRAAPFLVDDATRRDEMGRVRGTLNLGLTFTRWTEVWLAVHGSSTRNLRSDDARVDPETIFAAGDVDLGFKGAWRGIRGGALGVGGQAALGIVAGDRRNVAARVNVDLAALVTFDARYVTRKRLPIRATANLGWTLDNSASLISLSAVDDEVSRDAIRFGYGIQYSRVKTRFALDFPFRLGPNGKFGLDPIVELAWDVVTAKADRAFLPVPSNVPDAALPRSIAWLTAGLRANVVSGVFLDAAVDVGLLSPGYAFGPPTPAWQIAFGIGWSFDAAPGRREPRTGRPPTEPSGAGADTPPSTASSTPTTPDDDLRDTPPLQPLVTSILEASVVDRSGAAVVGVVRLRSELSGPSEGGEGIDESFATDPAGRLAVELPRGRYELTVTGPALAAPVTQSVDLQEPQRALVITVVRSSGSANGASPTADRSAPITDSAAGGNPSRVTRSGRTLRTRTAVRYDGTELTSSSATALDDLAAYLAAHPEVESLEIGVHTDDRGSPRARSQARAAAVVDGLVERGVARERLVARGYGDSEPVAVNLTSEGRRQNNRTVLRVRSAR